MPGSHEQPDQVAEPKSSHEFLQIANELIEAVKVLAQQLPTKPRPMMFLAGQAIECLLKSHLSRSMAEKNLKDAGHDIYSLWTLASGLGLEIAPKLPESLEIVSKLHGKPYKLRYPSQTHGIVGPNPEKLCQELDDLAASIRTASPPSPVPPPPTD